MKLKIHMEECKSAWRFLIQDIEVFGNDNYITQRSRTKWATLNKLYEDMFHENILRATPAVRRCKPSGGFSGIVRSEKTE